MTVQFAFLVCLFAPCVLLLASAVVPRRPPSTWTGVDMGRPGSDRTVVLLLQVALRRVSWWDELLWDLNGRPCAGYKRFCDTIDECNRQTTKLLLGRVVLSPPGRVTVSLDGCYVKRPRQPVSAMQSMLMFSLLRRWAREDAYRFQEQIR